MAIVTKSYHSLLIALIYCVLILENISAHEECDDKVCNKEFNMINGLLDKLNSLEDCRLPSYEEVQVAYLSYQTVLSTYSDDSDSKLTEDQKLLSTTLFDQWSSFYNHMNPSKGVLIKSASIRALICKLKPYQEAKFGVGKSICALQGVEQVMKKKKKDEDDEKNAHVRYLKSLEGIEPSGIYPEAKYPDNPSDAEIINDQYEVGTCVPPHYDPLVDANVPMKADLAKRIEEFKRRMDEGKPQASSYHDKKGYIKPSVKRDYDRTIMQDGLDMGMPSDDLPFSGSSDTTSEDASFDRKSDTQSDGSNEQVFHGNEWNFNSSSDNDESSGGSPFAEEKGIARLDREFKRDNIETSANKIPLSDKINDGSNGVDEIHLNEQNGPKTAEQQATGGTSPSTGKTNVHPEVDSKRREFKKRPPLYVPGRNLDAGKESSDGNGEKKEIRRLQSFFGMAPSDLPFVEESYAKKRISHLAFEMTPPKLVQERKTKKKSTFGSLFKSKQRSLKKYLISN